MFSQRFIDRPILSGVVSVVIVIIGIIGLTQLPIEQFPEIAPPTVRVNTSYTGANAETVMKSVITPLEESLNGVENMMYMTSTATNTGSGSISIFFRQGTNPDMAMVNVQNRVATTQGQLPAEVTKAGLTVRKRQNNQLKGITLYSPDSSYTSHFLTNYMKINIEPQISRIPGVGEMNVWGANYSMRIWLDPLKMAQYNLMPSDISTVLSEQNVESPTGTFGENSGNTFQYVLKYRGRYEEPEEYGNLVIKSLPSGEVLRLKDVASIEMGQENYTMIPSTNGHPGASSMIAQTAGSNANEVITNIDAVTSEIRKSLPAGMILEDVMSTKDFLDESIKNVVETLVIAVILVVIIVYVFLHSFRATLIPTLAIVVSLTGTFAFIYAVGFSLNLLTLFALVLVIGTVVDDSIVVVEAVQAKLEQDETDVYQATVQSMKELTSALVSTTLVFMAVFIPVCFIGGTSGTFYTQFGLTMAVAVAISLLNAMTLSPALCVLLLRPMSHEVNKKRTLGTRLQTFVDRLMFKLLGRYQHVVMKTLGHKPLVFVAVVIAVMGLFVLLHTTKTGLVPSEDMGSININVQASPGTSLAETDRIMDEIEAAINDIPQVKLYSRVTGNSAGFSQSSSAGSFTLRLKPWAERKGKDDDIESVMEDIYSRVSHITAAQIRLSTRPMISGYGMSNGFEANVQDKKGGTVDELLNVTRTFIDSLNSRPEISRAYTTFDTKYPQYQVDVDAALCKKNGVSPSDVLSTLSGYIGGNYSSNLNRFSKLYRVMVQASPEFRLDEHALNNMYVRNSSGQMSPIGQYVKLKRVYGSESLQRFNMFSSITVNGQAAQGYSSGQAIQAVKDVAAQTLPEGYGFEFGGMSREEASTGNTTTLIFTICLVFIFLILCALYESLLIPLAVILVVPFGLAGTFLFAKIWNLENNIYLQIGLIMLIGLLAKTAILLTEYASHRRSQGMTIAQAAMSAAKARLRPILMTSLTLVFGMLPLMFAVGVGANGNRSVGVGTVGGMICGTLGLILAIPAMFVAFQYLEEKWLPKRRRKIPKATIIALLIAGSMGLQGCAAWHKFDDETLAELTEDVQLPSERYFENAADSLPAWQNYFTDPELQRLIALGLEQNTDLALARLAVQEMQATLGAARLAYTPSADLSAQGSVSHYDGTTKNTYNIGVSAAWEPDIFGRLTNAKRQAAVNVLGTEAQVQDVATAVIATVADSYYTIIMLRRQIDISRQTLALWQETITTLEGLSRAGRSNAVAVLQARANSASLEASIASLEKSYSTTINSLQAFLKHDFPNPESVLESPSLSILEPLPLTSLMNRADVKKAEYNLASAFYATGLARAAFYPSLTISGTIGWTNSGGSGITNPGHILTNAVAQLTAPLWDRGKNRANLKIAEARQQEAVLQWQQTLWDAACEVDDALAAARASESRLQYDKQQIDLLTEAVRQTRIIVQYTSSTYLEVLTAQQSLLSAQLSQASDQAALAQARIALFVALR